MLFKKENNMAQSSKEMQRRKGDSLGLEANLEARMSYSAQIYSYPCNWQTVLVTTNVCSERRRSDGRIHRDIKWNMRKMYAFITTFQIVF